MLLFVPSNFKVVWHSFGLFCETTNIHKVLRSIILGNKFLIQFRSLLPICWRSLWKKKREQSDQKKSICTWWNIFKSICSGSFVFSYSDAKMILLFGCSEWYHFDLDLFFLHGLFASFGIILLFYWLCWSFYSFIYILCTNRMNVFHEVLCRVSECDGSTRSKKTEDPESRDKRRMTENELQWKREKASCFGRSER